MISSDISINNQNKNKEQITNRSMVYNNY
jgi:hypothetical protein